MKYLLLILLLFITTSCSLRASTDDNSKFKQLLSDFDTGYQALNIPTVEFGYRENMAKIQPPDSIERQIKFFNSMAAKLDKINTQRLTAENKLYAAHIRYEIKLNMERLTLERKYRAAGTTIIPNGGLQSFKVGWYQYYIHYFTGVDMNPEELERFGEQEVKSVKAEIKAIQKRMGYENDSVVFYRYLSSPSFYLSDKQAIINRYETIKHTVRQNLWHVFTDTAVADVVFMEWPSADRFTPPGYYSPKETNAYGTGVFFFNFSEGRHNKRAMDWLFMHEGIPGHHYQYYLRSKAASHPAYMDNFYYPGNTEGWGAYVEYMGKDMGLYQDDASYLGKWEWDLVRSTRILIDVGIHYHGWSKEEAIACWKRNIPGQDAIAEREVQRCMNWPAQALSYKVGAHKIQQLREATQKREGKEFDIRRFHVRFLSYGMLPLAVIEQDMLGLK
jgi:uncharacterized protein (DUF885 family)